LGIFASTEVNSAGANGLLSGNAGQLGIQLIGVAAVAVYAFVVSWILFKIIHSLMGMRLAEDAEVEGLDSAEHSETAYNN
jgi:ammonium transporter, Amt family